VEQKSAGHIIKAWREEQSLTKRAAGKLLNITPTHVYLLETGRRYPSPLLAATLAQLTGQSIDIFLNMKNR
jgi:DNA-binding XRE family transcriptional regulator